ncbi:MAG: YggS family pyridoxal phosphate-dependent enzyme [Bacteroidales bacterium]|nr:YggS family pyridoxal phosphate-dependent enzyme [Bacteroidales bacterium]HOY40014.1 YggS family pyridoxal phosphate-dependent enzyme [Bacteroidales bacterium]HQP04704.1 YggS family pyridoxal phosphate-dependent enzyme [Bacteroidales bacterium]
MTLTDRIERFVAQLPDNVALVAVSKYQPVEIIQEAYNAGLRYFGENKVQEIVEKHHALPSDIQWHFIGHLQTNKVRKIASFITCIQSVDSVRLMEEIQVQAKKNNRVIDCMIQFHIAREEAKYGFTFESFTDFLHSGALIGFSNLNIVGVMGMATFTEDMSQIRSEFKKLAAYYNELKSVYFSNKQDFKEISMGMSDDWIIAVEEGTTIIRIGTAIFGQRQKTNTLV